MPGAIEISGLRAGERLHEALIAEDDGGVCMTLCEAVDAELSLEHCLMSQHTGTQQESSSGGDG